MEPVLGKDVIIRFMNYSTGKYINYACAEEVSITLDTETKSVKTVGDGYWAKQRGQKLSYSINLTGLVLIGDGSFATADAFYLLSYARSMYEFEYILIFTELEFGRVRVLEGKVLATNVLLNGGSEGFAEGTSTLTGNGKFDFRDSIVRCASFMKSATVEKVGTDYIVTMVDLSSGPSTRVDYTINGGGALTDFGGSEPTINLGPLDPGTYEVILTPVCSNGYDGTPYTLNFVIEGGGDVDVCQMITNMVVSDLDQTSGQITFDAVTPTPADGYAWDILEDGVPVASGTATGSPIFFSGLTEGTAYTARIKTLCEAGVSESGYATVSFSTLGTSGLMDWYFGQTFGTGSFRILQGGGTMVSTTSTNSGSFPTANVEHKFRVLGSTSTYRTLLIEDNTALTTVVNLAQESDINEYSFTPLSGHNYTVIAGVGAPP